MSAIRLDWRSGDAEARDDALEACWADPATLPQPLCPDVAAVIARALALTR